MTGGRLRGVLLGQRVEVGLVDEVRRRQRGARPRRRCRPGRPPPWTSSGGAPGWCSARRRTRRRPAGAWSRRSPRSRSRPSRRRRSAPAVHCGSCGHRPLAGGVWRVRSGSRRGPRRRRPRRCTGRRSSPCSSGRPRGWLSTPPPATRLAQYEATFWLAALSMPTVHVEPEADHHCAPACCVSPRTRRVGGWRRCPGRRRAPLVQLARRPRRTAPRSSARSGGTS